MRLYKKTVLNISGFIILAAVWQFAGSINKNPAMPPLNRILRTLFSLIMERAYIEHIGASLTIILLGISIAVFFGFTLGVLMFRYENFKAAVLPVIESARGVAALTPA